MEFLQSFKTELGTEYEIHIYDDYAIITLEKDNELLYQNLNTIIDYILSGTQPKFEYPFN